MRTTVSTMVAALLLIPAGARAQDQTGAAGRGAQTSAPASTEPSTIPDIRGRHKSPWFREPSPKAMQPLPRCLVFARPSRRSEWSSLPQP